MVEVILKPGGCRKPIVKSGRFIEICLTLCFSQSTKRNTEKRIDKNVDVIMVLFVVIILQQ
jgi:hypothetical protein